MASERQPDPAGADRRAPDQLWRRDDEGGRPNAARRVPAARSSAGASGTVTEPFAIQAKFPTPFIHVYYAEGCTLAESFYQAVSGPYELLIVGDALCRPWARPFTLAVAALPAEKGSIDERLELAAALRSPAGIELAESRLYIDGRAAGTTGPGKPLTLEPATLDGGPHEAVVVAIGNDAVRTVARQSFRFETGDPARKLAAHGYSAEEPLAWEKTGRMLVSAEGAESIEVRWGARRSAGLSVHRARWSSLRGSSVPGWQGCKRSRVMRTEPPVRSPLVELRVLPPSGPDLPSPVR
jgi:hypothetical protein